MSIISKKIIEKITIASQSSQSFLNEPFKIQTTRNYPRLKLEKETYPTLRLSLSKIEKENQSYFN